MSGIMEQYFIENDKLKVGINLKGAELASIYGKQSEKEYMWQADPEFWGRHSCILFPIVGKLIGDTYTLDGKSYELKQHGFVRNRMFEVKKQEADNITFSYSSTEEDKAIYPYEFVVNMIYTIEGDTVSVAYEVENTNATEMYFSIGGHPGFNCPLEEGEKRSDYSVVFDQVETAESYTLNDDGFFDGKTKKVFGDSPAIQIKDDLFDDDALVFKDLKSTVVSLVNKAGKKILSFDYSGFPYLGIWSQNRESPFVCIEPWCGMADNAAGQDDFKNKEGVQPLEAGKTFTCEHKVSIFQS
ncbi:aldose 1-epimerase family protein [Chondrinema litorale]|uniref:aldose 1-epimerase family protein n=1 Tax=Chondrinema litorale TaxID=2994555 RepID=UPI002542AC78|nr:aldose 1-epimerase family protein [Chondrinema litorale]UZR94983.1 aldose 1-epimerase family protein [Chondrinema litorale]